jgi:uncharacterized membrane protein YgaE (UPF0421/DUF939 family)
LLVVEATLASTFVSGLQRVLSVVAGVALAVVLASIVGLTWWSLGALVAASIVVGQLLRLGPHLLEVPISAMLVLGVGHAAGAESVASGRIMETVIGAIAGVLVNVAFPPSVATRDASRAVTSFAKEIAALLSAAAEALEGGAQLAVAGCPARCGGYRDLEAFGRSPQRPASSTTQRASRRRPSSDNGELRWDMKTSGGVCVS